MKVLSALVVSTCCLASQVASLTIQECSGAGSCKAVEVGVVLDKVYKCNGPNAACQESLGVSVQGDRLTLDNHHGPRVYLTEGNKYKRFNLLNQEIAFDIDTSKMPCNLNGAFYFVDFPKDDASNGDFYCDAPGISGIRCTEMDVWEGNAISNALTSHSCEGTSCDNDGCQANAYKTQGLYGKGSKIDTSKPFTVVTQFVGNGALTEIKRKYKQGNTVVDADGIRPGSCSAKGGLQAMGEALKKGLVAALSIWDGDINWMDKCSKGQTPADQVKSSVVSYYNIRVGPIDSTLQVGAPVPTPTNTIANNTTAPTSSSSNNNNNNSMMAKLGTAWQWRQQ